MRFSILFLLIMACLLGQNSYVKAETLPQWPIDNETFQAQLIVRASPVKDEVVQVQEVFFGDATQGEMLTIKDLTNLSKLPFENANEGLTYVRSLNRFDQTPLIAPAEISGDIYLFLERGEDKEWRPAGWGSGVKWIANGRVFGYQQWENPGDYLLLPDREANTEESLRAVIKVALARKARFAKAISLASPQQKIVGLAEFVQPTEKDWFAFAEALKELVKIGPEAGLFLLSQADLSGQNGYHRDDLIRAFGNSHHPQVVPILLDLVAKSASAYKAIPLSKRVEWDAKERGMQPIGTSLFTDAELKEQRTLRDWSIAIFTLAELKDKRALPAIREAMFWAAADGRGGNLFENAVQGLSGMPTPDNVPAILQAQAFVQARASHSPAEAIPYAARELIYCLIRHPYKTALPALAECLLLPANSNGDDKSRVYEAHETLIKIVGQDLGKNKQPWLQWYKTHQN